MIYAAQIERFRLTKDCKQGDIIVGAGTPVKLLQILGPNSLLIQIPLNQYGEIQKVVAPSDLRVFGIPMWCYDNEYTLNEIDLYDNPKDMVEMNNNGGFEGYC